MAAAWYAMFLEKYALSPTDPFWSVLTRADAGGM